MVTIARDGNGEAADWMYSAALTAAVLDALPFAVLVLDSDGAPRFSNSTLHYIAERNDGLQLLAHGIELHNDDDQVAYVKAVERVRTRKIREGKPLTIALAASRPSGKRSYSITVSQLAAVNHGRSLQGHAVMVAVSDPARIDFAKADVLRALFGLTAAEAKLTVALVRTGSLTRASETCGLTSGSARQYMKRIFAKTAVRGQVELVALVLGATPSLPVA